MRNIRLHRFPDEQALNLSVAERIADSARKAAYEGVFLRLVLSGGRTPEGLYRMLSGDLFRKRIAWETVHFFFGDERCVPPDHEASNFRMASSALLDRIPISAGNIHRILGELGPEAGARDYERRLDEFFRHTAGPCFDIVLLGLGADGHTASLFPDQTTPPEFAACRVVPVTRGHPPGPPRISLTLRALNSTHAAYFLVTGPDKADIFARLVAGTPGGPRFPAQMVEPERGEIEFFADEAAASRVS